MKKCSLLFLLVFLVGPIILAVQGCNTNPASVARRTDLYYQLIRTFITDPIVHPLFSEEQLQKLRDVEKVYLAASESLKSATDQTSALYAIIECADEVCGVLESLDGVPERYKKELPVIRAAMLALRMGLIAAGRTG